MTPFILYMKLIVNPLRACTARVTAYTSDLSSKTSIANNIKRAHSAFLQMEKSVKPNSITCREIIEHCVIPTLLYGSEHWTLNESLISSLESFEAKLRKRILALPKFISNVVPCLALYWSSVRIRILLRKLFFLRRCIMNDTISGQVLSSILKSIRVQLTPGSCA